MEALENGFCSIEVDVWLVDGRLLVAHDIEGVRAERTLETLYLNPLKRRIRENGGRVYKNGPSITLLVDIKSEAESTYVKLKEILGGFREMLTRWEPDEKPGAVTIILSGNRPIKTVAAESSRLVAIDGRVPDLETQQSAALIPLVSDNWRLHFTWRGVGLIPPVEREKLRALVKRAHDQGRKIRFWATPESDTVWRELLDAGVDLIGTDDLGRLDGFLAGSDKANRTNGRGAQGGDYSTMARAHHPVLLWAPSQIGLVVDRPQRQRKSLPSSGSGISRPS
jgi:glycerophosphoryl diester phosphodiesterase